MKKKHIFLTTFIALLSVMSLMICSVYRNDQIQELGRSGKQAVIWYLENDVNSGYRYVHYKNYVVFYMVKNDDVYIVRILHRLQKYVSQLFS